MSQKILILSDIHEQYHSFSPEVINQKYPNTIFDCILIAGDMTNYGVTSSDSSNMFEFVIREANLSSWLSSLADYFNCPIYFIPGNHDIKMRKWKDTNTHVHNIYNSYVHHMQGVGELGYNLFITGMSLSPCYDMPRIAKVWDNMTANKSHESRYYNQFATIHMPNSLNIFVSHCPPYGVLDSCDNGALIGSKGLLKLIENVKPDIVICGHVHEHGGEMVKLGDTYVVNVATVFRVLEILDDGSCRLG